MHPFCYTVVFTVGCMVGAWSMQYAIGKPKPQSNINTIHDLVAADERLKDYQVRCTLDYFFVYDAGKLIGATRHGKDGIDSLIVDSE
jgi:hypothetical protein